MKNKRQRTYSTEICNIKRSVLENMEVTPQDKYPRSIELEEESNTRLSSPNYDYALHVDNKIPKLNTKSKYTPRVTETIFVSFQHSNEINILPHTSTNTCTLYYILTNIRVDQDNTIARGNLMNSIENKAANIDIIVFPDPTSPCKIRNIL